MPWYITNEEDEMAGVRQEVGEVHRDELLAFLKAYKKERRYMPTIAAMAKGTGMARNTVTWHLEKLREQKRVDFEDGNMARSLRLR